MIPVIVDTVNSSVSKKLDKINKDDAIHFIKCIIALSIYQVTPTNTTPGKPIKS